MGKINRLIDSIKKEGIISTIKKIINKIKTKLMRIIITRRNKDIFDEIKLNKFKRIIVFENQFGWERIMKQRPQQMANASDEDTLFIYGTTYNEIGSIEGIKKIKDNLYLLDLVVHKKKIIEFTSKIKNKYLMIYSTDYIPMEVLKPYLDSNFKIIYEYVDGIDENLCGKETAKLLTERHETIINECNPYIVATATKLYDSVKSINNEVNVELITNGVDYEHFKARKMEIPQDLQEVKKEGDILIGYYGALASWFDYELLRKLANASKKYKIVLIGLDYDKTLGESKILELENVHYLGKKEYKDLPQYLNNFDICIIPFLINEITLSTSPVKAFEYMAAKKPIITTDLPECRKYQSILIGKTHEEFLEKVSLLEEKIKDKEYLSILDKEARENTWENKFKKLIELIISGEKNER